MYGYQHQRAISPMRADLLRRVPENKAYTNEVRRIVEACFDLGDQLAFKRQEIVYDRTLSTAAKRTAMQEFVSGDFGRQLANTNRHVKSALERNESERKSTFESVRLRELEDQRDAYTAANAAAGILQVDIGTAVGMQTHAVAAMIQNL